MLYVAAAGSAPAFRVVTFCGIIPLPFLEKSMTPSMDNTAFDRGTDPSCGSSRLLKHAASLNTAVILNCSSASRNLLQGQ